MIGAASVIKPTIINKTLNVIIDISNQFKNEKAEIIPLATQL